VLVVLVLVVPMVLDAVLDASKVANVRSVDVATVFEASLEVTI
jgi:hypothetical protein